MSEFRIALIGGGGISRAHLAAANASGGQIRVVAVADPSDAARAAIIDATGIAGYVSVDALLAEQSDVIDALIVCTPPSARIDIIAAALERKIAVLAEKPLAHTLADARRLAELAQKHAHVPTAVGFCHRFVPAVVEMKRRAQAGDLGEIIRFENTFAGPNPGMQTKWMSDVALSGGGSFIDTGCHSLDLFRFLIGSARVAGAVFRNDWPGRGESSATVVLRGETCAGVIQSGWTEPARFTLSLTGTRGVLMYDYDRPTELLWKRLDGAVESRPIDSHESRFERQLKAFAKRCSDNSNVQNHLATFGCGLEVAQLCEDAKRLSII